MVAQTSIGKASGEGVFQGDQTNSWNTAEGVSKMLILKILIEINLYEVMAKFGKQDLEMEVDPRDIALHRVDGFDRLIFSLRQIISNCMFQIEKDDKKKMARLTERLNDVEEVADGIATTFINDVTKEEQLKINESHFRICFDVLSNVKEELHSILNRAGLIFRKGEETNLDEFMESIYNGG